MATENNFKFGLHVSGELLGMRQVSRQGNNGAYTQTFCGVKQPNPNGFGENDYLTTEIQIPNTMLEKGVSGELTALIGKNVTLPVWVRAYPSRAGAGYSFMLQEGKITTN